MPQEDSTVVDIRTDRIADRIAAIDDFVEAGYEVHVNFSPVIVREGWTTAWKELFEQLKKGISEAAKAQLACEIIFLTHNDRLHETNLAWHPKAEDLLWRPDLQEPKRSQTGGWNVRYRAAKKRRMVEELRARIEAKLPYCRIRYAF
jgi:DNA repair photolyase